jgi:membrane protein implicated in regulation of membrane protease activity
VKHLISSTAAIASLMFAVPAFAYVGPGAGLSMLGALWGLLLAVVAALGFVILWPLRRYRRRRAQERAEAAAPMASPRPEGEHHQAHAEARPEQRPR